MATKVITEPPSEDVADSLNHYYDDREFPKAYCGVDISYAEDCPGEAVNCVVCLDIDRARNG